MPGSRDCRKRAASPADQSIGAKRKIQETEKEFHVSRIPGNPQGFPGCGLSIKQSEEYRQIYRYFTEVKLMKHTIILITVFITMVGFAMGVQALRPVTDIEASCIDATNLINNVNFDDLKKNTGSLPNGIKINTEPSIKYPDDIFVYYKDIVLSVENDNGVAKVVMVFDSDGKEINFPTTKQLQFTEAIKIAIFGGLIAVVAGVVFFILIPPDSSLNHR